MNDTMTTPEWPRLWALEPGLKPDLLVHAKAVDRPGSRDAYLWASNIASRVSDEVAADLCAMAAVRWLLHEKPEWSLCWTGNTWCVWNTPDSGPPGPIVAEDRSLAHALFAAVEAVIRSRGVVPPPTAPAG